MKKNMKSVLFYAASVAALMLAASCNKENVAPTDEPAAPSVHTIEVTVPVGVKTKASYDYDNKATTIQSGDKLYLEVSKGSDYTYAGVLDCTNATAGTFSGTLNKTSAGSDYAGTDIINDCTDLTATLLPNGYNENYYQLTKDGETVTGLTIDPSEAFFADAKSAAVPQVANSKCEITDATSGPTKTIELSARNAVLFYTLSGNFSGSSINISVSDGTTTIAGSAAVSEGTATFAVGFAGGEGSKSYVLSIDGAQAVAFRSELAANTVYNVTRGAASPSDCISGEFSVASGKTVKFSKGNLQAKIKTYSDNVATASEWKFADNQYDFIGDDAGNNTFAVDSWVDLFSWIGTTADNDTYGLITFDSNSQPNHGNQTTDALKTEWGAAASKDLGLGWRTLTRAEWLYLFGMETNNIDKEGHARYQKYGRGKVHEVQGIILLPDDYPDSGVPQLTTKGTASTFADNNISDANWTAMETAGAVFLPAAGGRKGTTVNNPGSSGGYWSSTPNSDILAYRLVFRESNVNPANPSNRCYGYSVRLVQNQN